MIEASLHSVPDQVDWLSLTSRIAEGDEQAFGFFYERFFDRLFRYVLVMTRGEHERTREVIQTTMVKAVRYLKPFSSEEVIWSWLTQLAKTTFIDLLRKQQRAPEFVPLEAVSALAGEAEEAPDREATLEGALREALKLLAPEERQFVQWSYFEERSHKEVAELNETSPKAVESKLARIRQKLRKILSTTIKNESAS